MTSESHKNLFLRLLVFASTLVAAFWGLAKFLGSSGPALDALALGQATSAVFGHVGGVPIHCQEPSGDSTCRKALVTDADEKGVLWLGNSQLHGINQYRDGDLPGPQLVAEHLLSSNLPFASISPPNASLTEHYAIYEWVRAATAIKTVIIGLCYDDTREQGLRPSIKSALADSQTQERLQKTEFGQHLLTRISKDLSPNEDTAALNETVQEKSELALNAWASEHIGFWERRPELRGELMAKLYRFRNQVFGIKPTSIRKKIPYRYQENLEALRALLEAAKEDDVNVILYNIPIRQDLSLPYEMKNYQAFQHDTSELASRYGSKWINLEAVVPSEYWGEKSSTSLREDVEVDFMHFQAPGHEILAKEILELLEVKELDSRDKL